MATSLAVIAGELLRPCMSGERMLRPPAWRRHNPRTSPSPPPIHHRRFAVDDLRRTSTATSSGHRPSLHVREEVPLTAPTPMPPSPSFGDHRSTSNHDILLIGGSSSDGGNRLLQYFRCDAGHDGAPPLVGEGLFGEGDHVACHMVAKSALAVPRLLHITLCQLGFLSRYYDGTIIVCHGFHDGILPPPSSFRHDAMTESVSSRHIFCQLR